MGACLSENKKPKGFPAKNLSRQDTKLSKVELPENFDINRGLIMFGKNKKNKNFMLTFDFQFKGFRKIKLKSEGELTSERLSIFQLFCLHHQKPRNSDRVRRDNPRLDIHHKEVFRVQFQNERGDSTPQHDQFQIHLPDYFCSKQDLRFWGKGLRQG